MILLYLLFLLVPVNLGYHIIIPDSFVNGFLVDFLIPTVYVQDILVFLIFLRFWYRNGLRVFLNFATWLHVSVFLFLFCCFLSAIGSQYFFISIFAFIRLLLYGSLVWILPLEIRNFRTLHQVLGLLRLSTFLLLLLSLFQIFLQHSVFGNYLIFGEQPYTSYTYGIVRTNLFSMPFVPPYGLFRHPNILAGYLMLVFFLLIFCEKTPYLNRVLQGSESRRKKLVIYFLLLSVLSLTLSYAAIFSVLIGVFAYKYIFHRHHIVLFFWLLAVVIPVGLFFATQFTFSPSVQERVLLMRQSLVNFDDTFFLFGSGTGTSTAVLAPKLTSVTEGSFKVLSTQPVHNVFLLILRESGFFALLFFTLLLSYALFMWPVLFFPLVVVLSLDHYFWTIHQASLLFWLTLSLGVTYNKLQAYAQKI